MTQIVLLDADTTGFEAVTRFKPITAINNPHTDVCLEMLLKGRNPVSLYNISDEAGDIDVISFTEALDEISGLDFPADTVFVTTATLQRSAWSWKLETLIRSLASKHPFYCAAGNNSYIDTSEIVPVCVPGVMAVGALNKANEIASMNSKDTSKLVHLYEAGTNIETMHGKHSGTSMSVCIYASKL